MRDFYKHIYIQCLFDNNTLHLYACLTRLKQALQIKENICIKIKMKKNSSHSTLYMIIYKTIVETIHAIMTICKHPDFVLENK